MASSTNDINILITAKDLATAVIAKSAEATKAMSAELNASSAASREAGMAMSGSLIPGINGFTLSAAAIGATLGFSIHKAADFQQQLTKLVTSAGESQQNLTLVGDGIKKLAVETGESTTALADGMYKVSSAGFHGAEGLTVLKAAEQGAKAEGAELQTVADAVSSALIDYHQPASAAADITSKLVAATAAGKMRFEELAGAMPAILPIASAAHVSLSDILGDMASMTVHGMSAEQSAQNLADTIRHMVNPTAQQAKELAMLNMTTTQLAGDLQSKGLSGTLQEISSKIMNLMAPGSDKVILNLKSALSGLPDQVKELGAKLFDGSMTMKDYTRAAGALDPIAAKQALSFATLAGATHRIGDQQMSGAQVMQNYTQALAKATGDSTGLNVALMLTGENAAYTNNAIKSVAGATTEAGGNVKGWAEIQENFNTKWDRFVQLANTGAISLGQVLLPAASSALDVFFAVNDAVSKIPDEAGKVVDFLKQTFTDAVSNAAKKLDELRDQTLKKLNDGWQAMNQWLKDNAGWLSWTAGFLGVVFGPTLIAAGVKGIIAGAMWAGGAIAGGAAWVAQMVVAGAASLVSSVKMIAHGISAGAAWTGGGIAASVAWVINMAKVSAATALTATKSALHAADAAWAWIFNATRVSFVWVTQELPKLVVAFVRTATAATISAGATSLAWVKNAAVTSFVWVTQELPKIIAAFITTSSSAVVQSAIAGGAWVKNAAIAAAAWVVTELPKIIQAFIAVAGAAVAQAAVSSGAWVSAAAASSAAFEGLAALVATPMVMPAIGVAAALASIALVYQAAMQARDAINSANDAKMRLNSEDSSLVNHFVSVYKDPNSDAHAKALAKQFLHNDGVGGYALGTNFAPGGLAMVGEKGPELVRLPTGSRVYNARETQQMVSGGNGVTINMGGVTIANQMDEQKFLANLGWRLALR